MRQVVGGKLTAGELSTFVIYALYVGANVGSLAGVISNLIQVPSLHAPTKNSIDPPTTLVRAAAHAPFEDRAAARLAAALTHAGPCCGNTSLLPQEHSAA